jgi:hypothetical protein
MINDIRNFLVGRQASKDARLGIDATELRVLADLGKKPEWNPVENAEHMAVAESLGGRAELEELRADERRGEDELARHPSSKGLVVLLTLAAVIETFGGILIMRSLGRENPERTLLGIALAIGTLGFTAFVAKSASGRTPSGETPRRTVGSMALLAVYTVFVLSVAAVRVEPPEGEDGGDLGTFAEAVLMIATTILPAFTAEWIFRRRHPSVLAARELRNTRRRIRRLTTERTKASKFVRELARERDRYEGAEARGTAAYRIAHLRTSALADDPTTARNDEES